MPISTNPTIRQRRLARTLRCLRTQAGLTHAQAAEVLDADKSKVGRIENAQSGLRLPDLRALLDLYGVTDPAERAEIERLAREAKQKGWWSRYSSTIAANYASYVAVEWDAAELYNVETSLVPGLLQVPEYTEAVIGLEMPDASRDFITNQINVRAERRKVLTREDPLQLWVIITESVLHHRVAESDVMRTQFEALIDASTQRNIELQVLPMDDPINACLYGPFVVMSFPGASETDVVYTDAPTSTIYYEEPAEIETYTTLFRRLNMAAANVNKSRAIIRDAIKELM